MCQIIHNGKPTEYYSENMTFFKLSAITKHLPDGGRLGHAAVKGREEDQYQVDPHKATGLYKQHQHNPTQAASHAREQARIYGQPF